MDAYETSIYTAIVITGIVLLCIILYFAFSVFRNQRKFVSLQRSYFLNEVSLLEKERSRIARDLHDEIGPLVSLSKLQASGIIVNDEASKKKSERLHQNLEQVMQKLGEISSDLTPSRLIQKGLRITLSDFIEEFREASRLDIDFEYKVHAQIRPEQGIHVYRIIKEVVHNCQKHAKAQTMVVLLSQKKQKLIIEFEDDGQGFDVEAAMRASEGHGLRSLKSRAEMMGGKFEYYSSAGGTRYYFEIPIDKNDGK